MKKTTRKVLSLAVALSLSLSLAACGTKAKDNNNSPSNTTAPTKAAGDNSNNGDASTEVVKPTSIKVMMDGTVFTEANGRDAFQGALEAALGIKIEFNQPDHSGYYDVVSNTFASGAWPDVILLGAAYYSTYASAGALADISSYWENSDLKKSSRFVNTEAIDALYTQGKDGVTGLYGFSPTRGNGCVTYIREEWLTKSGLSVPTTYDEFYEMIKYFTENDMDGSGDPSNTFGVVATGLIGPEPPFTNYLPEFYQDAYPDFYIKDGVWVDGFSEDAMKSALTRLQDVYQKGYLDKETITNKTSDCRDKFYANKCGVFTYWAGTWANNLASNLASRGLDDGLVILPPIKELGSYVERQAPVWCVTSKSENPEGVYKYFIESMLDGGEVQSLWTYGVKGTHWNNVAETVTWGDNEKEFKDGEFHFLPSLENPSTLYTKNHIDPMLSLATFEGEAPGASAISSVAGECAELFNDWAVMAPVVASNSTISGYAGDLTDIRNDIVAKVVAQGMSVDEGMNLYNSQTSAMVKEILESLNK